MADHSSIQNQNQVNEVWNKLSNAVWKRQPLRQVRPILGALSLLSLSVNAYKFGVGSTIRLLIDRYEEILVQLFGWANPYIEQALRSVHNLVGWDLSLYPHWKHLFVLVMVYFGARLRSAWSTGNRGSAVFLWIAGISVALCASIAAGTVPLAMGPGQMAQNMFVATFPVAGVFVFDLTEIVWTSIVRRDEQRKLESNPNLTRWQAFVKLVPKALWRVAAATIILALGALLVQTFMLDVPSPGLILLGLLLIVMACYWLYQGRQSRFSTQTR